MSGALTPYLVTTYHSFKMGVVMYYRKLTRGVEIDWKEKADG